MTGLVGVATAYTLFRLVVPLLAGRERVRWVQIDLEVDDHDHLITPEERLRIAMVRQ